MEKISGIYKITNTITGDFYIGSSKNIKRRWSEHKCAYTWNKQPNNQLYKDMQTYGLDKFSFEILEEIEVDSLKEKEQQFIETLKPTYNNIRANGFDIERRKEYKKEYNKEYQKEYQKTDKYKEYQKEYHKSEKGKESHRKASNKYQNQFCCFNGETITLHALSSRFYRAGIPHPTLEAKKYLIKD